MQLTVLWLSAWRTRGHFRCHHKSLSARILQLLILTLLPVAGWCLKKGSHSWGTLINLLMYSEEHKNRWKVLATEITMLAMFHSLFPLQKRQFPYANVGRTWMFPPGIMGTFTFYYLSSTGALGPRHRAICSRVWRMYILIKITLSCLAKHNYKWHYVNRYILAGITLLVTKHIVLKALLE